MKLNQEQIEDRLVEALLRRQSSAASEQALQNIENALDAGPSPVFVIPAASPWRTRLGTIAACAMIGLLVVGIDAGIKSQKASRQLADANTARQKAEQMKKDRVAQRVAIDKAVREQADKVEERRKVLATIVRSKGIIYKGQDSFYGESGVDEDQEAKSALEAYNQIEAEKLQLESQIKSLLKYDSDELMRYASGLDLPDNIVRTLYPEYLKAIRQLNELKIKGIGDRHPTVLAAIEQINALKHQLDEGIVNLRATLQAQLAMATDRLKTVEIAKNGTREEAITRGLDAQDYVDAKRDFETDQQLLQEMRLKQINLGIQERIDKSDQTLAEATDSAIRDQADKVEERRKVLATIVRTKGIIYKGQDSFYGQSGVDEDQGARAGFQQEAELNKQVNQLKSQLAGLDKEWNHSPFTTRPPSAVPPASPIQPTESSKAERYSALVDPSWKNSTDYPLSTFSIDVDNASYSNIRRFIRDGQNIPADSVRIEECINAFDYNYPQPAGGKAFSVNTNLATCPWNENHLLAKVGIKGRDISKEQRPVSNLVFLIDVSGSMQEANKLPLVKESLKLLLHQLDERDSVSYVVYAGSQGVVLPPTKMTESGRARALEMLGKLEAGGSTNGGAGIQRAYQLAKEMFIKGGVNRVILATDGDFNVGITDQSQLVQLVKERAANNIYLSVLGFGTGNLNDALMESISKDGNGNHYYIDSIREGRKVLLQRLSGTLITIAKDVKIQIEFNPAKVGSYRLIGYANRQLRNEDFNNDKVDAGDIGAGHTVTAFYELVPLENQQVDTAGVDTLKYQRPLEKPVMTKGESSDEWLTLKLRHKSPEGDISSLQESVVKGPAVRWQDADSDFTFASAVALFGMKLRGMDEAKAISWPQVRDLATPGLKNDRHEDRSEFVGLLEALEKRGR